MNSGTDFPLIGPDDSGFDNVNADLYGMEFDGPNGLRWKVTGPSSWSEQYVNIECVNKPPDVRLPSSSCANASLLRESHT